MKNQNKYIIIILEFLFCSSLISAQTPDWNTAGNTIAGSEYLGGKGGSSVPLQLRTQTAYPINFYTDSTFRMTIESGGNVQIGNTTTAQSLMHLHKSSTSGDVMLRFTNGDTGSGSGDGFSIGIDGTEQAEIRYRDNKAILFHTNNTERVRINASGEVGIGIGVAASLLHQHRSTATENYHQITNSTTGSSNVTDGFRVGITSLKAAELRQEEDTAMVFFTGGTSGAAARMYIEANNGSGEFGRVGIGTNSCSAQLHVVNTTSTGASTHAIMAENNQGASDAQLSYGMYTVASNGSSTTGISAIVDNTSNNNNVVMRGMYVRARASGASNVTTSYGIDVLNDQNTPTGSKYGIYIQTSGSATNRFGMRSDINDALTAPLDYAVYGSVVDTSDWAGYFVGKVYSTKYFTTSDGNLKENVNDLGGALGLINQLQPKTFNFKADVYPYLTLDKSQHMGLIAQDLEIVLPELVTEVHHPEKLDEDGNQVSPPLDFKAVDYLELIPLLIQGMKEQQQQIAALQNQISNPKSVNPINDNDQRTGKLNIELIDIPSLVLDQNDPNPFKEFTTINFFIPDDVKNAKIVFYNASGRMLNSIEITEKGNGSLQVFGSSLHSGTYIYTIIADGVPSASYKMIKVD